MIRVFEPGDIIYTRDAYHNIFRAMVDANGQLTKPPASFGEEPRKAVGDKD